MEENSTLRQLDAAISAVRSVGTDGIDPCGRTIVEGMLGMILNHLELTRRQVEWLRDGSVPEEGGRR